jgi:LPXTG-site transpeptidase (sortase) family protein
MTNTGKISYYLGNAIMLLSLSVFVYIVSPILLIFLFPPKVESVSDKPGMYVTIPKIKAQSMVEINVDPYDEAAYQNVLKKSVAHAKGTKLPGEKGTVFIFAHSSGNPWEITRMNTIFLRLNELEKGDRIEVQKDGKRYVYKVTSKKEVFPSEVNYLQEIDKDQLILQTCTPIGTDWKRLLVFAQPEHT